jgi:Na+-translocating ferredoxin:NAD+ oxidoreductase RnfC subunit
MSAPSRRPEIRRRRTRKDKILKLRQRLAGAKEASDRTRLEGKLRRMELGSPGNPLLKKS